MGWKNNTLTQFRNYKTENINIILKYDYFRLNSTNNITFKNCCNIDVDNSSCSFSGGRWEWDTQDAVRAILRTALPPFSLMVTLMVLQQSGENDQLHYCKGYLVVSILSRVWLQTKMTVLQSLLMSIACRNIAIKVYCIIINYG